jgi:hypothetical protein
LSQHSIYNSEDIWVSWISIFPCISPTDSDRCLFISAFSFQDGESQMCRMAVESLELCEFWCFSSSIIEDSFLLGYDAAVNVVSQHYEASSCFRMDGSYKLRSQCCIKVKGSD